jgi:hypothetical protein
MTSHAVPPVPQRERVFAFRAFVLRCFGAMNGAPVLDVAGGKGDLSWLLKNADGLDAIVVDPRVTDHTKITRTAMWHYQMLGMLGLGVGGKFQCFFSRGNL